MAGFSFSGPDELFSEEDEEDEDSEEEATLLFLFLFRFLADFAAVAAFVALLWIAGQPQATRQQWFLTMGKICVGKKSQYISRDHFDPR